MMHSVSIGKGTILMTMWTPMLSDVLLIIGPDGTRLSIGVNEVFKAFSAYQTQQPCPTDAGGPSDTGIGGERIQLPLSSPD